MKKATYTDKKPDELKELLEEKRVSLRKLRFETSGSKTRNVKEGSNIRKEIARIMTELNKTK